MSVPTQSPAPKTPQDDRVAFEVVLDEELDAIQARRAGLGQTETSEVGTTDPAAERPVPTLKGTLQRARDMNLVGLTFSGGGIRSATFNLGVLQGLANLGLLRFIDYLSTVSGGGYVGNWLAACIRRRKGLDAVAQELQTDRGERGRRTGQPVAPDEAEPIRHLRRYSNYLAPHPASSRPTPGCCGRFTSATSCSTNLSFCR